MIDFYHQIKTKDNVFFLEWNVVIIGFSSPNGRASLPIDLEVIDNIYYSHVCGNKPYIYAIINFKVVFFKVLIIIYNYERFWLKYPVIPINIWE